MTPAPEDAPGRWTAARIAAAAGLVVMALVLTWKLLTFLGTARWAVFNPHELDYGEGIVWQQMRMIADGRGYAPLTAYPAIVFHYPPVYHVLTWLVASATGVDDLMAGRALSSVSTLLAAAFVGLIAGRLTTEASRAARWSCGLAAALVALTCYPVARWSAMMRVDMVGFALTFGGVLLAMAALRRPALIYLAATAFVGAVFTRQTLLAAPGAVFLVLLVLRPSLALRGIATCVVLGLSVLAGLSLMTHGQFIHHVLGYNINRFAFYRLRNLTHQARFHVLYIALAALGVWLTVQQLKRRAGGGTLAERRRRLAVDPDGARLLMAVAYAGFASGFLILAGKSGSSINYFIEWFLVVSLFVGVAVRPAADAMFPGPGGAAAPAPQRSAAKLLVLAPILIAAGALMAPTAPRFDRIRTAAQEAELATLTRWIAAADRPVISDDMVVVREAGKEVTLEPAIVAELTTTGAYDERPLVQLIRDGRFAFFVTAGQRGDALFDARYTPGVASAIDASYPRVVKLAGMVVHLPATSLPPQPR
jgi:hypothetical protein